jgi:glycopeptide antibiotics resistance protein
VFTFALAKAKGANTYVCKASELQSGLRLILMNDLGPFLIARSFGNANIQFNIHMIIPFQMQLFLFSPCFKRRTKRTKTLTTFFVTVGDDLLNTQIDN